jgi:hypothetical protein
MSPQTDARDAALRRLRRVNRWAIAGSVALTGLFAEVAADAFPGRTVKTDSTRQGDGAGTGHRSSGSSSPDSSSTLQSPTQAPQATEEENTSAGSGSAEEGSRSGEGSSGESSSGGEGSSGESSSGSESSSTQESPVVSGGS